MLLMCTAIACFPAGAQHRFSSRCFSEIRIDRDCVYAIEDEWDFTGFGIDNPQALTLDIYYPLNDTMKERPMVVCLFGGAFFRGNKDRRDMKAWCDSLAHYGYVAVAINYRIGFNPLGSGTSIGADAGVIRAMYRAAQDCRAAVRFLKSRHIDYAIDTSQIFLLGNSAGAITSLNAVLLGNTERPAETYSTGFGANNADLGCLDCTGSFRRYPFGVKAVVSLWGAVHDVAMFAKTPPFPVLFIHGTLDPIVPYYKDYALNFTYGKDLNVFLFGSKAMKEECDRLGWNTVMHSYEGQGHCFYSCGNINIGELDYSIFPCDYWWPVFYQVIHFLAENNSWCKPEHLPDLNTVIDFVITELPEKANFRLNFHGNLIMNNKLTVYNAIGEPILSQVLENEKTVLALDGRPAGIYVVEVKNHMHSKLAKIVVKE